MLTASDREAEVVAPRYAAVGRARVYALYNQQTWPEYAKTITGISW